MDNVQFTKDAWEDFSYWMNEDRKTIKRIMKLIKDIKRNGYNGIGTPAPLSENLSGYWSRRIDDKNRIVYKIDGDIIVINQCGSHYRDK
ncbi:MAG: Txe/YoeB family addiction module toxin [Schwartzia sp.]|nr:Txe/YoeB family addiction module toxin [Schwartzia sp. (in: firmicutes)]